jgi:hypothetical protein
MNGGGALEQFLSFHEANQIFMLCLSRMSRLSLKISTTIIMERNDASEPLCFGCPVHAGFHFRVHDILENLRPNRARSAFD